MPSFSNEPSPRGSPEKAARHLSSELQQLQVASLTEGLKSADWTERAHAASGAREGVSALAVALKDPCWEVRYCAACSLERMGPAARDAVPALVGALEDPEGGVRLHAARALGQIGPVARDAVPALGAALKDPDKDVRISAACAISRIASF